MNSLERSKALLESLHQETWAGDNEMKVLDPRSDLSRGLLAPLDDHVILIQEATPEVLGSLHLPQEARKKARPHRGRVVAVGPGLLAPDLKYRHPLDCVPGDVVYFYPHAAQNIAHDGQEYVVLKEGDVICKVIPSPPKGTHGPEA